MKPPGSMSMSPGGRKRPQKTPFMMLAPSPGGEGSKVCTEFKGKNDKIENEKVKQRNNFELTCISYQ